MNLPSATVFLRVKENSAGLTIYAAARGKSLKMPWRSRNSSSDSFGLGTKLYFKSIFSAIFRAEI